MKAINAAAVRKAWAKVAKCMDEILVRTELDSIIHRKALEAQNLADGALMEPPRNCDEGTAEEQKERFKAFCTSHGRDKLGNPRCEECKLLWDDHCELTWAQMPYRKEKRK